MLLRSFFFVMQCLFLFSSAPAVKKMDDHVDNSEKFSIAVDGSIDSSFCEYYKLVRPSTRSFDRELARREQIAFWRELRRKDPKFSDTVARNNRLFEKVCLNKES